MFYYTVNKIGDGTEDNPFRPDFPEGTPFVCHYCLNGMCLTVVNEPIPNFTPLSEDELMMECEMQGITFDELMKWFVGGN